MMRSLRFTYPPSVQKLRKCQRRLRSPGVARPVVAPSNRSGDRRNNYSVEQHLSPSPPPAGSSPHGQRHRPRDATTEPSGSRAMQALRHRLLLAAAVLLAAAGACHAHNITKILAKHPGFSTFNHYLSATHLDTEINRRLTITVLAVDNSAMSKLLAKHPTIYTIKNVLSLHILADYYGSKRLHQIAHRSALVSSLFQATGAAPGTTGFVNVTNLRGGRVAFGAEDNDGILDSRYVKSIKEIPYKISIVQISGLLNSPEADAPAPAPALYNITILMRKKGCSLFADLAASTGDVEKTFEDSVDGGLTVFCPYNKAMRQFMPKYKKLAPAARASLLLYHGLPVYNSLQMLKTTDSKAGTFASDAKTKSYNYTFHDTGEVVKIDTRINTARVTGTVIDEQPLAIYIVDKVLEPNELFKVPETAPAPKAAVSTDDDYADGPVADDDTDSDDQTATNLNGATVVGASGSFVLAVVVASLATGVVGF